MGFNYSSLIRLKHLARCIIWKHRGYFTRLGPAAPLPLPAPQGLRAVLEIPCAAPAAGAAKKQAVKDKPGRFGAKAEGILLPLQPRGAPGDAKCLWNSPSVQVQQGKGMRGCAGTQLLPVPRRTPSWGLEREYQSVVRV